MSINFAESVAVFEAVCTVDEAESLLGWLQKNPQGEVDMRSCTHLHSAVLQVVMAMKPRIVVWPEDEGFKECLQAAVEN